MSEILTQVTAEMSWSRRLGDVAPAMAGSLTSMDMQRVSFVWTSNSLDGLRRFGVVGPIGCAIASHKHAIVDAA